MKFAYFKLDAVVTDKYLSAYSAGIKPSRERIFCELQTSLGAVGFKVVDKGCYEVIEAVYFDRLPRDNWSSEVTTFLVDGKPLFRATPDSSYVSGKVIADDLKQAGEKLKDYPPFDRWLCERLGVVDLLLSMFGDFSLWRPCKSRCGDFILFRVSLSEQGEIRGKVPDECIRIKHSEYVALLEE
ncbi:hypothetical protein DPK85_15310 [Salmonella enterica subsp. diarizonae]|nr:hypothetical protein [Salmonella enterica subsp. diarizonae]EDS6260673.1 hypothetical protein [Salmonella enterica subsp. diarizonae]